MFMRMSSFHVRDLVIAVAISFSGSSDTFCGDGVLENPKERYWKPL